jgi:hypothetical protein
MKNFISHFILVIVIGFLTIYIASCAENSKIITMTTPKLDSVKIGLSASNGSANINWGDGTQTKARRLWRMPTYFSHSYSDTTIHTITIFGNITTLDCCDNQLTSLDVSKLEHLQCMNNYLTELNISKNVELVYLECSGNQLISLDLSNNANLESLVCDNNLLTTLDVSNNQKLMFLFLRNNNLSATSLNNLFKTLHNNHIWNYQTIYVTGNIGMNNCNQNIATERGWSVNSQ